MNLSQSITGWLLNRPWAALARRNSKALVAIAPVRIRVRR